MSLTAEPKLDGRNQRVVRGKQAAIDAILAIFAEGRPYPTFADIADRAGISERTLFRYFGTYDEFITEASRSFIPSLGKYFVFDPPAGNLRDRLARLIELRLQFVKKYGAMVRTVDVLSVEWTSAREISKLREQRLKQQLESWLGDDRSKLSDEMFLVLHNLLSFQSMDRMSQLLGNNCVSVLADAALAISNSKQ